MRICVQWSTNPPQDYTEIDATEWNGLPNKGEPIGNRADVIDAQPGWICALNVQGIRIAGYDYYAVRDLGGHVCEVYCWNSDPKTWASDEEYDGQKWTFHPLTLDSDLSLHDRGLHKGKQKYNTRQYRTSYSGNASTVLRRDRQSNTRPAGDKVNGLCRCLPFQAFPSQMLESIKRYGVYMNDDLMRAHQVLKRDGGILTQCDWRQWTENIPQERIGRERLVDR